MLIKTNNHIISIQRNVLTYDTRTRIRKRNVRHNSNRMTRVSYAGGRGGSWGRGAGGGASGAARERDGDCTLQLQGHGTRPRRDGT